MSESPWSCPRCSSPLELQGEALACPACGTRVADAGGFWSFVDEFAPAGFSAERRAHLEELAREHFWFPARRQLLSRLLDERLPRREHDLAAELGCGTGGFLAVLAERCRRVVGIDAWGDSLQRARSIASRTAPALELARADLHSLPLADGSVDLVVALDVLEHLDDLALLREARRIARQGAGLLVSAPAHRWLWSDLDRAMGHRRRYARRDLVERFTATGWQPLHTTHYQALLLPLLWLTRKLVPSLRSFERRPSPLLSRLLGAVNRFEVRALGGRRLPWGSSIVGLAVAS